MTTPTAPVSAPALHESLKPYAQAAAQAGFHVHLPAPVAGDVRAHSTTSYFHVIHPDLPGHLIIGQAAFPGLGQKPDLTVPVTPNAAHGSGVCVDFDGEPSDLPALLDVVLAQSTVLTRWVKQPSWVPVRRMLPAQTTRYTIAATSIQGG